MSKRLFLVLVIAVLGACTAREFPGAEAKAERGLFNRRPAAGIEKLDEEAFDVRGRTENVFRRKLGANKDTSGGFSTRGRWKLPPVRADEELWVIARQRRPGEAPQRPVQEGQESPGEGALRTRLPGSEQLVPLPLEHTDVQARVSAFVASVLVKQQFRNPYDTRIEVEYVFPLPQNAAVSSFVMVIGERRIRGIVREKEEAERIYLAARAAGHVASLLTQQRPNVFTQKVANIEPGKRIDVEIGYDNTLAYSDGWFAFVFPMVVGPRFNPPGHADGIGAAPRTEPGSSGQPSEVAYLAPGERSGHDISLSVTIEAGVPVEEIRCATHQTVTRRKDERSVSVSLVAGDSIPDRDFVLGYRVGGERMKSGLMVHRQGKEGWFSLLLYPPRALKELGRQPLEMIFVIDCSGSMRGEPLAQAKAALLEAVGGLRSEDTFQLIRFSEQASAFGSRPVPASHENRERARRWIQDLDADGGTYMIRGLRTALDFPHDENRLRFVCFLTDGFIGNESEIMQALHERVGATRVFSFGVGSSPNRYLMNRMARLGRGVVSFLGPGDEGSEVMRAFMERVSHPGLCNLKLDFHGARVTEVYPKRMPDLFSGRPVAITGRFQGELPTSIGVEGQAGGRPLGFEVPVADAAGEHPALARVWARMKIAELNTAFACLPGARGELARAIKETALEHALLSRFTAFVAVDSRTVTAGGEGVTVPVAVPVPRGVKYETTVGSKK